MSSISDFSSLDTRPAAVAGMFYSADRRALRRQVSELLAGVDAGPLASLPPKAIIAPHAGYVYSGPPAAAIYAQLAPFRAQIRTVVLLGPSHRVAFAGVAAPTQAFFATPLGRVPVARDLLAGLMSLPQVSTLDEAHRQEHSLEVHLPFLQQVLDDFRLVPLVVGDADADAVADVLEVLWGGPETLIVVSSDLSHYHDYETARWRDRATAAAIETLRADRVEPEGACGARPLGGLLRVARRRDLRATTVALCNSGDTAGDRARVVGYGAWRFDPNDSVRLSTQSKRVLLDIATHAIRGAVWTAAGGKSSPSVASIWRSSARAPASSR